MHIQDNSGSRMDVILQYIQKMNERQDFFWARIAR